MPLIFLGTREQRRWGRRINPDALADYVLTDEKTLDWGIEVSRLRQAIVQGAGDSWVQCVRNMCELYGNVTKPTAGSLLLKKGGWSGRNIALLLEAVPEARAIGIVRDPRGVYASGKKAKHSREPRTLSQSPYRTARAWSRFVRTLQSAERRFPGRVQMVFYEDCVRDISKVVNRLWNFLGLEDPEISAEEIRRPPQRSSKFISEKTAHLHDNVRLSPVADRIEGWKQDLSKGEANTVKVFSYFTGRKAGYW